MVDMETLKGAQEAEYNEEEGTPKPKQYKAMDTSTNRQARLELIPKDGIASIIAYMHIVTMTHSHDKTITLHHQNGFITIEGRNLKRLISYLRKEYIETLYEFDSHLYPAEPEEGEPIITKIYTTEPYQLTQTPS